MNIDYLKNTIIPQREKENKDSLTNHNIYIIYDLVKLYTTFDEDFSCLEMVNNRGVEPKHGYLKENNDENEFIEDNNNLLVSEFYMDRFVALFFTKKAAEDYLKYQSHNLSENAYIYSEYTGYANREMNRFLEDEK